MIRESQLRQQLAEARLAERSAIVLRLLEMARIIDPDEIARTAHTLEHAAAVIAVERS